MTADKTVFVDTTVFLYTIDNRNPVKQTEAHLWVDCLWNSEAGRLSWQVLNEFYANAVRLGVGEGLARRDAEVLAQWQIAPYSLDMLRRAWHWVDSARVSYWDALILAAAESAGSSYLLSEDFQNGRVYGEVTVVNPFTNSPREFGCVPARRH